LDLTDASTVASATAAVVGTGVTVATFVFQLRKPASETKAPPSEPPHTSTGSASSTAGGVPAHAAGTPDKSSGKSGRTAWPTKIILSLSSGIAAGLVVFLISSFRSPGPTVSLISPTTGTAVSRTKTFSVTGKVSHLGNETIWLTDYDSGYTVDDEATIFDNGRWAASDSDVGDPGQALPFPLTLRVILADPGCAAKLQKTMSSNGDYLTALPGGCTVADSFTVNVTTP
jgi:hypothetical protein